MQLHIGCSTNASLSSAFRVQRFFFGGGAGVGFSGRSSRLGGGLYPVFFFFRTNPVPFLVTDVSFVNS